MYQNSFTFRGIKKDYLLVTSRKRSYWAPIRRKLLTISGRPGALLEDTSTEVRVEEVNVEISADDKAEYDSILNDFASWIVTEHEEELIFDDEPTFKYFAVVDGSFNPEEIVSRGYGTIRFICPDPYKYGEEQTVTGPVQATWKENFVGKVSGSDVENPHVTKHNSGNNSTGLFTPSNMPFETGTASYDLISVLDGNTVSISNNLLNYQAQMLFSYNLIQAIERKYGPIPASDKVAWLKENIKRLTANWHGRGSALVSNPVTKADFVGKVPGSVVENANIARRSTGGVDGAFTELRNPDFIDWIEFVGAYNNINGLDGVVQSLDNSGNGKISQHLFSFNLIEHLQRKYNFTIPGANIAEKVEWMKANIVRLTANWHGRGSVRIDNPITKADFAGKVAGSTVENPHLVGTRGGSATLLKPIIDNTDNFYDTSVTNTVLQDISTLNNVVLAIAGRDGNIAQQLFSFNLIEHVQRKYNFTVPGATTYDKVAWLKVNVTRWAAYWYGKGSGPSGNKANITVWYPAGLGKWNSYVVSHTKDAVTRATYGVAAGDASPYIDNDGFIHFLAYAEASDGITASRIETDFIELEVEVKSGYKASLSLWNRNSNGTVVWSTLGSHTNSTISKLTYQLTDSWISQNGSDGKGSKSFDENGIIHFLAYADPSNGLAPSRIETDFIELEVEVVSGGYKATFNIWNSDHQWGHIPAAHTKSTISNLERTYIDSIPKAIDSYGFVHYLAYADPSNGLMPSRIETDYIELEIESSLPHLPLVIENEGTAESYPVITAKLKEDTTFVAIGNGEEINMIGEPVSVDDIVFEPKTILLNDPMTSTVGWGNAGFTPDGSVKAGSVTSDGNNIIPSSYGTGSAWHGPAVQKSISEQLQDFSVEFTFNCSARTIAELGKVQLFGLDPTNKKIFMLGMGDYWNSREQNMPEGFLYNATEQRKEVLVRNAEDKFERFYGYMRITRIGREIEFFLKQVDANGNELGTKIRKYFDSTNEYQAKLASVGLHFAQFGTYLPIESLGASHVTVTRINQQQGIPIIGRAGDTVVFDNKVDLITLNGEDITKEKAFIGEYFAVTPGTNGIVVEPSDAIETIEVRWPPAWR